jgi:hypothetical protein
MAKVREQQRPRPPPWLTMAELAHGFPIMEIPVTTSTGRQRATSPGARSKGLAAETTTPRRGDSDNDAFSFGRPDLEARLLPYNDMLSTMAARIQRDIGIHHELTSASTTTSSASASYMISCSDGNPTTAMAPLQSDTAMAVGSDLGSKVFFDFEKNDFWCRSS